MSENASIQYSLGYQDGFLDAKKQFERPIKGLAKMDKNGDIKIELLKPQGEWIPVSERLPDQNGFYITTCRDICENRVHVVMFDGVRKKWGRGGVIAWQPLPEPYKKGGAE